MPRATNDITYYAHFKKEKKTYDPAIQTPVLRRSICTGETTAGFRNKETGRFEEVMLIRSEKDVDDCMSEYGISEKPHTEY